MKAHYRIAGGQITFEVEGENVKDLYRELAQIQEVFDVEHTCGVCRGDDVRLLFRQVDDFTFYELACAAADCRARFAFGQAKKGGGLFPKRKDADGNWLPNRGWEKYEPGNKHADEDGAPPMRSQPRSATPAAAPKAAGPEVPSFPNWETAERSPHWGEKYLKVSGRMVRLEETPEGSKYRAVPEAPAPASHPAAR